jgi:hypothetical protein
MRQNRLRFIVFILSFVACLVLGMLIKSSMDHTQEDKRKEASSSGEGATEADFCASEEGRSRAGQLSSLLITRDFERSSSMPKPVRQEIWVRAINPRGVRNSLGRVFSCGEYCIVGKKGRVTPIGTIEEGTLVYEYSVRRSEEDFCPDGTLFQVSSNLVF